MPSKRRAVSVHPAVPVALVSGLPSAGKRAPGAGRASGATTSDGQGTLATEGKEGLSHSSIETYIATATHTCPHTYTSFYNRGTADPPIMDRTIRGRARGGY